MSSVRAFLAIPLNTKLRKTLAGFQGQLAKEVDGIRWSQTQSLHLTLHFFGETTQENLEKIKASMLSVKRCFRPFKVEIKGVGGFPGRRRARILWLGLEPDTQVKRLHRDIRLALKNDNLSADSRIYTPHLTLGRARRKAVDISNMSVTLSDTPIGHLEIDRMVLYESRLHPGGAEHIPLFTVNFDEETDNLP
jgi:2'-5' RNA ligase